MKMRYCIHCKKPISFIRSARSDTTWIPVDPAEISADDIAIRAEILAGKKVVILSRDGYQSELGPNSKEVGFVRHVCAKKA